MCQSGFTTIQGERHPTGGQHSLSGNLVKRRRGWCRPASRLVPFTAFGGQSFSASWAAPPGTHCTQAVTQQAPQVIQGLTAGPHQKGDEGMLQAGYALGEVSLPSQFPVCGFALNVGLL